MPKTGKQSRHYLKTINMKRVSLLILLLSFLTCSFAQENETERKLGVRQLELKMIENVPSKNPFALSCKCDNNLVKDGSFRTVTVTGSDINGNSPYWKKSSGTPQWSPTMGACDSGFVSMWGNKTIGESISQPNVPFVPGKKYRITFNARFINQTGPANSFVRFRFFSGGLPIGYSQNITNTGWATYTLPDWIAPSPGSTAITIAPENDNTESDGTKVSWGQIDNVCVQEVSCNCGKWGTTAVSSTGFDKKVKCGQTVTIKRGVPVTIKPSYFCSGGCEAKYTATLTSPSGKVQNFSGNSFSFTAAELCNYRLTITPICGDKKCEPCSINFFSTIGCPGDVTGRSKLDELTDVVSLGEFTHGNFSAGTFTAVDINSNGEMVDIPNGSYKLQLDKEGTKLLDAKGTVIRNWKQVPGNIPPGLDCEQQEDLQFQQFRQNQLPGLIAAANQQCRANMYCLIIYCNSQPRVAYTMLIKPTLRKCMIYEAAQYQAAIRFYEPQ